MTRKLRGIFAAAALGLTTACTPAPTPLANGQINRPLTDGEIAMAYQIFGDSIDYSRVRVHKNARSDTNRAHKSSLYMTQATYRDDYAASRNAMARSKFIHELAHIWQSHNGKDLVGEAVGLFFRHGGDYDRAYDYDLFDLNNFENLSIEQQASIIEDYFYLNETATPWNAAETCRNMEQRAGAVRRVFPDIPINPVCRKP